MSFLNRGLQPKLPVLSVVGIRNALIQPPDPHLKVHDGFANCCISVPLIGRRYECHACSGIWLWERPTERHGQLLQVAEGDESVGRNAGSTDRWGVRKIREAGARQTGRV